jgi:plastocyanin
MARIVLMLAAMLALGLPACSSDDGGGATRATVSATEATTGATGATGPTDATTVTVEEGCVDLTSGPDFTITISKFAYRPDCFTVNGSQAIRIVNKDKVLHSFTVDGTQVDGDIKAGETFFIGLPISGVLTPGTHDFYCKYHTRLTGTITVL